MVTKQPRCKKCNGQTYMNEFLTCLSCGLIDYTKPERVVKRKPPDAFRGNVHFVEYNGDLPQFMRTKIRIEIKQECVGNRINVVPDCPYCGRTMEKKSTTPKQKNNANFIRYLCKLQHRILLNLDIKDEFCWRD